jgi:hypothetical protein
MIAEKYEEYKKAGVLANLIKAAGQAAALGADVTGSQVLDRAATQKTEVQKPKVQTAKLGGHTDFILIGLNLALIHVINISGLDK